MLCSQLWLEIPAAAGRFVASVSQGNASDKISIGIGKRAIAPGGVAGGDACLQRRAARSLLDGNEHLHHQTQSRQLAALVRLLIDRTSVLLPVDAHFMFDPGLAALKAG
jgi:hypothetical protein